MTSFLRLGPVSVLSPRWLSCALESLGNVKEAGHLGWVRFIDPAQRIAVCREELWLGMEKANPVAVTGIRMGWLLDGIGHALPPTRPRALRSAGSGCSKR
ncbi:MAG: hypothetical protein GX454_09140 [Brooklawnia sp.]|nr:hypothetical protein [Brooklawnia sp.]